jgi:hypothetical protein
MDIIGSGSTQWLAFVNATKNERLSDSQRPTSTQLVNYNKSPTNALENN